MGTIPNTSGDRDERVDHIIAAYLEAADAGKNPNPFEIIAQHSEFAVELASFFSDGDRFERLALSFQEVAGLTTDARRRVPYSPTKDSVNLTDLPSADNELNVLFGDYELLAEIARGGMGVVYKARQISLNRVVALKMILAGNLASPDDLQRFHAEAEAAAGLNHPGIVPIYEVGTHNDQHYFSMAYVDGPSLAETLRAGTWRPYDAAYLVKQICEAVQYAHEHNVIHRDLKPANILLQRKPPTPPTAGDPTSKKSNSAALSTLEPCVTDFGLAKRTNIDSHLTGTGQILGTPSFMAPEQASGDKQVVDARSDVFSLGAILYQTLTGRPPFQEETPLDTLTHLLNSDPLPPRLLNRGLPGDLEAICMKCLEKEPNRRYPSARHLGNDLNRFLNDEAVQASGVNLLDCMNRLLRQNRNEEYFRGWGSGLIAFGMMILASHFGIYCSEHTLPNSWLNYLLPRSFMFAGLLFMLWQFRPYSILPTNSAERLVWVVWTAYLIALGATNAVQTTLDHDQRESYASFAILAGFGFLVMGVHVWGGGYLIGLVFMIAAPILAFYSEVAPLLFGTLWAIGLCLFGLHYWQRGRA